MNPYGYDRPNYRSTLPNESTQDPLEGIDLISRILYQFNLSSAAVNKQPPTAPQAIEDLDTIIFDSRSLNPCSVCGEVFQEDEESKKIPCKHVFHTDCILPWLTQHNTCPLCRFELPTLDIVYEEHKLEKKNKEKKDDEEESYHSSIYS